MNDGVEPRLCPTHRARRLSQGRYGAVEQAREGPRCQTALVAVGPDRFRGGALCDVVRATPANSGIFDEIN